MLVLDASVALAWIFDDEASRVANLVIAPGARASHRSALAARSGKWAPDR
jgi:hypothetical protein